MDSDFLGQWTEDNGQRGRLMTVKRLRAGTLCPLSSVLCPKLANHSKNQPTTHQPQRNHHETEHQLERTRDSAPQGHLARPRRGAYGRDCRDGHGLHVHGHTAAGTDHRDHPGEHPAHRRTNGRPWSRCDGRSARAFADARTVPPKNDADWMARCHTVPPRLSIPDFATLSLFNEIKSHRCVQK